jgi:protein involved in sex pheromone biosynthesis
MKRTFLILGALAACLSLNACGDSAKRTDGTAGEAVSDMDKATDEGGVQADAVVIDNNAGPTVTADGDSAKAATPADTTRR